MLRGDLRIPADAPILRPGQFARFAAFWCKAYVPAAYGPDVAVQPTREQIEEWLVADAEASKAEHDNPTKLNVFDQHIRRGENTSMSDLWAAADRRDQAAIDEARRDVPGASRSRVMLDDKEDHTMHSFTLTVITSGRKEIIVQKDHESRSVRVKGFDPKAIYFAEDAKDLAALFTGVEKLLTD